MAGTILLPHRRDVETKSAFDPDRGETILLTNRCLWLRGAMGYLMSDCTNT